MAGARTLDLVNHEPAWSHRAVEAKGCRDGFGDLVFTLLEGLRASIDYVVYQALHEHLVKRDGWRLLVE